MKFTMTKAIVAALAGLAMLPGCFSTGGSPNMDPASWAPPVPDQSPVRAAGSIRPLQLADAVQVTIRAGTAEPIEVVDVVDSYGNITLPHLGEFKVGQLTTSEAEKAVADAYIAKGFFTSPNVTIVCPNMIQKPEIFVTGEVLKRGNYEFRDGITLWQAIVGAGDVTPYASNKIKLVRNGVTQEYDIRKIKSNSSTNPVLMPGDIVEVVARFF